MAYQIIALLACLVGANAGFAVTINSAKQMGTSSYIKIEFSHSGRLSENKFEFRLDPMADAQDDKVRRGRIVNIEAHQETEGVQSQNFLIFNIAGKIALPCELTIINEDESSSYIFEIHQFVPTPIQNALPSSKKNKINNCVLF